MSGWGDILTAALPALVEAGGSYLANQGQASALERQNSETRAFNSQESALQRQFEMEKLAMQIAAQGGGSGDALAKAGLQQRAYESAINAMLTGAQNQHGAANTLLQGWTLPARA